MRFYGHDVKSAELSTIVLKRLKASNAIIEKVNILIANHMVRYVSSWTDGAVKRFINRVGSENIDELFELQWCDQIASEGRSKVNEYDEFIARIEKAQNEPLKITDLAVTGDDLASVGIPRSKQMGEILSGLLDMVLDYPTLNNKKTLLEQAELLFSLQNQEPSTPRGQHSAQRPSCCDLKQQ